MLDFAKWSMSRPKQWWQRPIKTKVIPIRGAVVLLTMAVAIVAEILASPMARIWFGLLIVSAGLVAVFLQFRRPKS
jgi:protein-S-isoprenylcysteine O-methyltransferase Ste14